MNIIQKPTQLQAPSIDFSKRRLVKISVTDLGLCMPLIPMVRQLGHGIAVNISSLFFVLIGYINYSAL